MMKLTPREKEVLALVAAGQSNMEIAETLCLQIDTIKGHILHIMNRLGANNRTHAVVIALNNNLIDRPQTDPSY